MNQAPAFFNWRVPMASRNKESYTYKVWKWWLSLVRMALAGLLEVGS